MTVDRQMRRYNVPRVAFINKCDRSGADPYKVSPAPQPPALLSLRVANHVHQVLAQIKDKLRLSCAFVTLPIGLEDKLSGLIDVVHMRAIYFEGISRFMTLPSSPSHPSPGDTGSDVRHADIPADMVDAAKAARRSLVEAVGEVDEEMVRSPRFTTDVVSYVTSGRYFSVGERPHARAT